MTELKLSRKHCSGLRQSTWKALPSPKTLVQGQQWLKNKKFSGMVSVFDSAHVCLRCCRWWDIKASPQQGHQGREGASLFSSHTHSCPGCWQTCLSLPASDSRSCLWSQGTPANYAQVETDPEHMRPSLGSLQPWAICTTSTSKSKPYSLLPSLKGCKGRKQQIHRTRGSTTMAMDLQRALGPTQALLPRHLLQAGRSVPPCPENTSTCCNFTLSKTNTKFNLSWFSLKDG